MGAKQGKVSRHVHQRKIHAFAEEPLRAPKEELPPHIFCSSTGPSLAAGMNVNARCRSVRVTADLDNERTYAVAPQEVVVEHEEGELLGGRFLPVRAEDLPGMPELAQVERSIRIVDGDTIRIVDGDTSAGQDEELDVAVAIVLSIAPTGPIARFSAQHPGVLTAGTVILQAKKLSETSTRLTVARWGWSVVSQKSGNVPQACHPGVKIKESLEHSSFARITKVVRKGSIDKWNRTHNMSSVRKGDCVVAVNGVPVSEWLGAFADINERLARAGDRQEWIVVRVPGMKAATGNMRIAEMIQACMASEMFSGSGGSDCKSVSDRSEATTDCDDVLADRPAVFAQNIIDDDMSFDAMSDSSCELWVSPV